MSLNQAVYMLINTLWMINMGWASVFQKWPVLIGSVMMIAINLWYFAKGVKAP